MINLDIADLLYEIADIFELKNVNWKPRAYRRAAQSIEKLDENVSEIYKKKGIKGLREIPGVGEAIAKHIEEYLLKGKVKRFQELKKSIPKGLSELLEVSSLGAKKASFLYRKLGIKNLADLRKAVKHGKVSKLSGFGEKSQENIGKGLEIHKKGKERALISDVLPIANSIVNKLKTLKQVKRVNIAGSLARMKETIGDIDILVTSSQPKAVIDFFTRMPEVKRIIAKGDTKATVILRNEMQADLRVLKDEEYGAAQQYFIGNKEHNIKLREIAIKKRYKLSEYGLFYGKTKIACKNEQDIYKKLGLQYIPIELRENNGEIEAAKKHKIPHLIEFQDIKGDLHVHTKYSDGVDTIEKMAEEAKKLGYKYIAIADHSKTRKIAHGLTENELLKQWKEIDKLNKKFRNKIRILKSNEVDILGNGSLDYSDKLLSKMEVVIASVHSGYKSSKRQMTDRIIKALENKYVNILAHPTGRLINRRPEYEIDLEQIFDVAKEKKKILEINAFPNRLDLKDVYIKRAKEKGIKLSIGTDAHSHMHLQYMFYGVSQARRGWAEKKDVINTLNLKELLRVLRRD
ncbi:MAG: DNA polymerase/3'-5' exonuclease PolX [Nanoarchaeota archaeon]|nr:DNA polymerase/3'-5' exonuclease PolX [Nanoarchaeota archaeon]